MYCVLVTGMPASGKTRLSEYLSHRLGLPMLSKDRAKEILFDDVGFRSRKEKVALGVAAMDLCYYFAESLMKLGSPFLLENNFESASRPGLEALLRKYRCTPVTVFLTGDYETVYRRFLERDLSPERHRGHVVNTCYPEPEGEKAPYAPPTLDQFIEGFHSRGMADFDPGGPRLTVDTTDFSKVDYEAVARQLNEIIAKIPPPGGISEGA